MTANLSWMERATLFHEQLGLQGRPSVRVRSVPPPVREEPTLVREEPTLVREEPTLVREEPTLVNEEPTSELDIPDFRQHTAFGTAVVVAIGAVIALGVAAAVPHPFASRARPTLDTSASRVPQQPAAQPRPEPRSPEPAEPSPPAPESGALELAPLELAPAATAPPAKASNATAVTVHPVRMLRSKR